MINKREFFRKLKKNRFLVLAVSVIVITVVYYGAQKAIDSYNFKSNSDWVEFEDVGNEAKFESEKEENKGWFEKLFGDDDEVENVSSGDDGVQEDGVEEGAGIEDNASVADDSGKLSEDEVDLELEETVDETSGSIETDDKGGKEEEDSAKEEKIYVYITGEVNVPRSCNFE